MIWHDPLTMEQGDHARKKQERQEREQRGFWDQGFGLLQGIHELRQLLRGNILRKQGSVVFLSLSVG